MKRMTLVLCLTFLLSTMAYGGYLKGYLDEMGDSDYFTVYAEEETLEITFDYPSGTEFWVLVLGEDGEKLGYFDLTEGEIIRLTGGGYFTAVIISHYGDGKWTAHWEN